MTVCSYYQRGRCKYGDNCRYEHPGSQRDQRGFNGAFGGTNQSNSGPFGRPTQQSSGAFGGNRSSTTPQFHLSKDDIEADLKGQRPIYPLSCYGPGRDAPRQLIEGPVEISPEELRARFYSQRAAGNEAGAAQEESQLHAKMEEQVKTILNDLNGAIRYVEDGASVRPNRLDIVQGNVPPPGTANTGASSNPFSNPPANAFGSQPQNNAFSQSSAPAFGQTSTPAFGKPGGSAFGQPSNPGQTTSAFGQPSALGTFGKPSMPGASAFGQTSALGGGSAFGKPSMPGGSAFGQPSAMGQQPAFGQASAPGTTSAFGKPTQPSAFGQANALGQNTAFSKPAFGQSAFGQASQPGAATSPFGQQAQNKQTSQFNQAQPTTQPSPFGQQSQPASSQPNPFSAAATQTPAFGQAGFTKPSPFAAAAAAVTTPAPAQTQPQAPTPANPFAANAQTPAAAAPSPFATQTQAANPFTQAKPQQAPSPFAQQAQFTQQPQAAPTAPGQIDPKERYKEGKPEEYEGEKGQKLMEVYQRVAQIGAFNPNEEIPLTPPKCEWIVAIQ